MSACATNIDRPLDRHRTTSRFETGKVSGNTLRAPPDLIYASPSLRTRLRNVGVRPTQWLGRPQFRGVSGMSVGTIWMLIPTLLLLLLLRVRPM